MRKQFTFSQTPVLKRSRSLFDLSCKNLTSGNMGDLIPFYLQEVYPGDTFKMTANCVVRTSSPLVKPIMDNLFLDTYFFYVPSRLVCDDWQRVFGENTESPWANSKEYEVPKLSSDLANRKVSSKSVADYLGIDVGTIPVDVDITLIPFRGFAKVWDDWFRDQNNVSPMHIQKGAATSSEVFNDNAWSPANYMGKLPKVAKMHDYFTSCLPAPQKGDAVPVQIITGDIPVTTKSGESATSSVNKNGYNVAMSVNGGLNSVDGGRWYNLGVYGSSSGKFVFPALDTSVSVGGSNAGNLYPDNLVAVAGSSNTTFNVNDLRLAFQVQKMLERDARGGTRYVEYLLSHFGVSAGDTRLQRSEFLGGKRTPLNINQVTQTSSFSSPDADEVLGEQGAYSLSFARARSTKGFVEHGFVFGVCCIRQFHTYQQGVERFWTRTKRTDFYDPVFANIGEQPVYKSEIFAGAGQVPFGYNEAWADLRYRPNKVTGQMRSAAASSLDVWHLADNYTNAPTLNEQFIQETPVYLDRALTVGHEMQDQFIMDFYVQNIAYRELPTYSIPSLIDHN